jgi:hypothetical protein
LAWLCAACTVSAAACATAELTVAVDGGPGDGSGPADARPRPDAEPVVCTLVPQFGCFVDEACDLSPSEPLTETECRDVDTPGMDSAACTARTDCAAGWVCLGATGEPRQCVEYCTSDSHCAPSAGGLCLLEIVVGSTPVPDVLTCSKACHPITSSGCPTGFGCFVLTEDGGAERDFTHCFASGTGTQGSPCTSLGDCAPGFNCVSFGAGVVECARSCNVDTGAGCAAHPGTICGELVGNPTVGGVEYGICS